MRPLIIFFLLVTSTTIMGSTWFFVPSGSVTKLLDNFHDTNGTPLESHTMDTGPGWNKAGSVAQIQSNVLVGIAANTDPIYVADASVTAGTLTADIVLDTSDSQVNLYVGTNNAGSSAVGYIVICYPVVGAIDFYQSGIVLHQAHSFSAGAQTWKAVLTATDLTFYIDGVQVMTSPVAAAVGTYFGLEMYHPGGIPGTTWSSFKTTSP